MATKLYSDDTIIDAKLDKSDLLDGNLGLNSDSDFESFFEIERVTQWIQQNGFKRTALQLPDGFLPLAYRLSSTIGSKCTEAKVYVLADTSYRSCCIDDVAAQHANCDSLVHFGESCLSQTTERIPVLYVFGKFLLDAKKFEQKWEHFLSSSDLSNTTICLLCDSTFSHHQFELTDIIKRHSSSSVVSFDLASDNLNDENDEKVDIVLGRRVSKSFAKTMEANNVLLVFIGSSDTKLLPIWLMTFPLFNNYVHYVPSTDSLNHENSITNRLLRKRLFLIEKLRDANVVGLVVGTLEIKGYVEAIQRVRQLCKAASKKLYVLSIGKLNEAKLSNFASDINAFIMLSCPFGIVLDSKDYYKPIVSMFEAEVALNSSKDWFADNGWTAEFKDFVKDEITAEDVNKTDVSLITGKLRGTQVVDDETDDKNRQIITYSAGDYFADRSWKGLDDGYRPDDVVEIKTGLTGTSMGYSTEKKT